MQTRRGRRQEDLFITAPLSALVPTDHILRRIDAVLDLGWLHDELLDCYCPDNGRPSIAPEKRVAAHARSSSSARNTLCSALDCCARTHQAR